MLEINGLNSNKEFIEKDVQNQDCKTIGSSKAAILLVLTKCELVAIDLTESNWPSYESPYLNCLDSSSITTICHIGQVSIES